MIGKKSLSVQDTRLQIVVDGDRSQVARIQVTGTFVATLNVRGTVNGTDYENLQVERESDGVTITDISAPGIYLVQLSGLQDADIYVTAYTSGAAVVAFGLVDGSTLRRDVTVDLSSDPPTIGAVTLKDSATATEAKVAAGTAITSAHNAVAVKDAALGLATDAAVTNPATDASVISWLRGLVKILSPTKFIPLSALSIATEATVWTPAAGKKFRLMGFVLSSAGTQGDIVLKDGTAGTTILVIPKMPANTPVVVNLGNGVLSALADNLLTATGVATQTLSGFVFGIEE